MLIDCYWRSHVPFVVTDRCLTKILMFPGQLFVVTILDATAVPSNELTHHKIKLLETTEFKQVT